MLGDLIKEYNSFYLNPQKEGSHDRACKQA